MPGPLDGIRVMDLARGAAGSIATMVMSDFGAQVVKVEPPGGDPFRSFPASLLWDRGKQSATLELKTPGGREHALRLAERSDVVVESFRPGVADRLGLGYEALSASNPGLVYCSITGFGPRGRYARYKGYEGLVAARSGRMMAFNGQNRLEGPNYAAVQTATHSAAMAAVRGVVAALYVREATGLGQRVETSLLQAITPYDLHNWIVWQMMVKDPEGFPNDPQGDPMRLPTLPYLPARTRDGRWLQMANLMDRLYKASMHAIGLGHVFDDPRFAAAPQLPEEAREELRRMMLLRFQERTLDEWMDLFVNRERDVGAEPFMTTQEGMDHPQSVHNGHVVTVEDPRVGPMRQLGPLFLMRQTPAAVQGPAPLPGQHTAQVLAATAREPDRPAPTPGPTPEPPAHPFQGVTVLDCSTVIAGPLGCSLVAELGARVIRVETLEGDWMRRNVKGITTNRTMGGAESICVDLKTDQGQEVLRALIARADVLVHNMRPGAAERAGVGHQQATAINPRLVYLYVAGYGSTGPYSHRPAMHPIPGAVDGGVLAQAGRGVPPAPDTPMTLDDVAEVSRKLARANEANPDPNTSMAVATAIAMGLYARRRLGVAQYMEVTMLCANAYANAEDFFSFQGKPPRAIADPQGYGLGALYRLYRTSGGWVFLACPFQGEWEALCRALDLQHLLADHRFATAEARARNDPALSSILEGVFAASPAPEWERRLSAADVPCVQAEDRGMYHFFAEDPHVQANGFTVEMEHPRLGRLWRHSPVIGFSLTPGRVGPGPLRGQHTRGILQELGYTPAEVDGLRASGVVDWER